ncbi:MAG: hypothetical protein ABSC94_26670 [Polyangiaceae bacterium]
MLKPGDERGLVDPSGAPSRGGLYATVDRPALDFAIERCESLLRDFPGVGALDVEIVAGTELLGRELLGGPAQAVRDVAAVEAKLATAPVDTPDDDVRVGMIGIEMVHCQPFELATQVAFDARHQAPDVVGEVELRGILG